jgi:hypothetical protein
MGPATLTDVECSHCFKKLTKQQERRNPWCEPYCSHRCHEASEREALKYKEWVNDRKAELPTGATYWSIYWTCSPSQSKIDLFCIEWSIGGDRANSQTKVWKQ